MALAIFDLDNTLLAGDSDYLWGQFLIKEGIVDKDHYEKENQRFYDEYKAGTLDIYEFLAFSLKPLSENETEKLQQLRRVFIDQEIQKILLPKAFKLVKSHADKGDTLMIITATNRFVTEPIANLLGIEHLLATDPEMQNGRYTGRVEGIPCFQDGKVKRLAAWLKAKNATMEGSWFYSDSHNDLPLLNQVTNPVVVDADEQLMTVAKEQNWPIITLRE